MFLSSNAPGAAEYEIKSGDWFETASAPAHQGRRVVSRVDVRRLPATTLLVVETGNSRYRIAMAGAGSQATIQGGPYFQEEADVSIKGARFAGSVLKMGWIAVGLSMELTSEGRLIVTSRVRGILVETGCAVD